MPTTQNTNNTSTCGFFAREGRCARKFQNLPHTSVNRFRKCGEKPRSTDQTPVLGIHDLRFCWQKSGCTRRFSFFPALPKLRPFIVGSSINNGIRDNIQLSRKRQRAVAGKPNDDPSLSPPHVESTATASLGTSYRNVKQPNKAIIGNDQECCPATNPAFNIFHEPHASASLIRLDYPTRYSPIASNISPTLVAEFCEDGLTLHSPL